MRLAQKMSMLSQCQIQLSIDSQLLDFYFRLVLSALQAHGRDKPSALCLLIDPLSVWKRILLSLRTPFQVRNDGPQRRRIQIESNQREIIGGQMLICGVICVRIVAVEIFVSVSYIVSTPTSSYWTDHAQEALVGGLTIAEHVIVMLYDYEV
jgi:hypothetical protein